MCAILLCSFVIAGYSQSPKLVQSFTNVRVNKKKPSVYISFERKGKRPPLFAGESSEGIWLRLHNNTKWNILIAAFGIADIKGETGVYYELESTSIDQNDNLDPPVGYAVGHLSSYTIIKSAKSILFSVPREHLPKNIKLKIEISYDWENLDDVMADREPKHFVYFYSSKIPD